MKYFKILIIPLILLVILSISCERDDICPDSTPTTPRLIINLIDPDADDEDTSKNVFDLVVIGTGNDAVLEGYSIVDVDNIILPLKTDENTTQYSLIKEATVDDDGILNGGNEDIVTINYSREQVYVSRACGYKTIFKNVTLTIETDTDNWMLSRQATNDNQSVENETAAHFKVSH